jgi:hypothetical protein
VEEPRLPPRAQFQAISSGPKTVARGEGTTSSCIGHRDLKPDKVPIERETQNIVPRRGEGPADHRLVRQGAASAKDSVTKNPSPGARNAVLPGTAQFLPAPKPASRRGGVGAKIALSLLA